MPNLTQEDKAFLEANRGHYNTWVQAQFVKNLDGATRSGLKAIAQKFDPRYNPDLWCNACVTGMLEYVYKQYDKTKEAV